MCGSVHSGLFAMACAVQVLLRGRPNWSACLALVDQVVDASAPCQVSSDRSAATVCRLGAAHPKMHGSFMALTGEQNWVNDIGVCTGVPRCSKST